MKTLRTVSVFLLIGWMSVIFYLSHQDSTVSSDTSGDVIRFILGLFRNDFDTLSPAEQLKLIDPLQFIVRKGAHFTAYGVLGFFSFFTYITYTKIPLKIRFLFISVTCLAYSMLDEIHQTFIPGRSGELRDVCIDFSGSLLFIAFLFLVTRKAKFIRNSDKGEKMSKNDLVTANDQLFERNEELLKTVEMLKAEISTLKQQLETACAEKERLEAKLYATPPLKALEEKVAVKANVSKDTEYAAGVIGKIVVSATKYCNLLASLPESSLTKEQINLILGRTEVSKSEILKEISKDCDFEDKKSAIENIKSSAEEYFNSVMAQTE